MRRGAAPGAPGTRAVGCETLGPPPPDEVDAFEPGWLAQALFTAVEPGRHDGVIEFRVGDEVAHLEDGDAVEGPAGAPDVTVTTDSAGFFHLFVDRDASGVQIEGDGEVLAAFLASLPERSSLSARAAIR